MCPHGFEACGFCQSYAADGVVAQLRAENARLREEHAALFAKLAEQEGRLVDCRQRHGDITKTDVLRAELMAGLAETYRTLRAAARQAMEALEKVRGTVAEWVHSEDWCGRTQECEFAHEDEETGKPFCGDHGLTGCPKCECTRGELLAIVSPELLATLRGILGGKSE